MKKIIGKVSEIVGWLFGKALLIYVRLKVKEELNANIQFLKEITDFAIILFKEEYVDRMHLPDSKGTRYDILIFGGFFFYLDLKLNDDAIEVKEHRMLEQCVKIWYHSSKNAKPVLDISWRGEMSFKNCHLRSFETDKKWQEKMKALIQGRRMLEQRLNRYNLESIVGPLSEPFEP